LIPVTLRRVAPAQTLPRGESGPEAGDGSVAQTCSSVLPRREPTSVSAGFVFSKQNTGISFRACPRSQNAKPATARFGRRGFPYGFSRGIPSSAYTTKYPIPAAPTPRAMAVDTLRQECDERTGEYRENGAGKDRDPLQGVSTHMPLGSHHQGELQTSSLPSIPFTRWTRSLGRKGLAMKCAVSSTDACFQRCSAGYSAMNRPRFSGETPAGSRRDPGPTCPAL
jgi:hypothetical protein